MRAEEGAREKERENEGSRERCRKAEGVGATMGNGGVRNLRASVLRPSWGVAALHTQFISTEMHVLGRRSSKGHSTSHPPPPYLIL